MSAKHRTAVVAAALILLAVVVPLASADGPMGGTEHVSLNMPANGAGIATRGQMPASSKTGKITVKATSQDDTFFDHLTTFLTDKPTFGARAVSCVLMYAGLKSYPPSGMSYKITEPTLQDLFLEICIQLALTISQQHGTSHAGQAAAAKCGMANLGIPVTITRAGSGYSASVSGTSYTPKRSAVRVSCTRTATGLTIVEKPRSRTAKLAQVAGPILGVGFSNGTSSTGKLAVSLGVR